MPANEVSNPSIREIRTDFAQSTGRTNSRVKEAPQPSSKLYDQLGFQPHGMTKTFSGQQRKVFNVGTTVPADAAKNVEEIHDKLVEQTGSIANVFVKTLNQLTRNLKPNLMC